MPESFVMVGVKSAHHRRLNALRQMKKQELNRNVTFDEVIGMLLDQVVPESAAETTRKSARKAKR